MSLQAAAGLQVPGVSPPSAGFIEIGDPANFVAWAPFSETNSARLQMGQTGTVLVDALPNLKMSCKVTYISPMATLVGGVSEFYVEASLSPPDRDLRNGYTATVNVDVAEADNVLTVPSQAIFSGANGTPSSRRLVSARRVCDERDDWARRKRVDPDHVRSGSGSAGRACSLRAIELAAAESRVTPAERPHDALRAAG